jgi:hypothetical protein
MAMAEQMHVLRWQKNKRSFDMRSLLQLAMWGVTAAASLTMVALAAFSDPGSQRLISLASTQDSRFQTPSVERLAARSSEVENETRRLAEAVQKLGTERERLLTRIASLEHTLEDVTGSLKRETTVTPPAPSLPSSVRGNADATPGEPRPSAEETAGPSGSATLQSPPATTSQELAATSRLAGLPASDDAPEPEKAKAEFGVEVGGAVSFDGLRVLWNTMRSANAAQFEGLHPVVIARENRRTRAVDLRLVVGPVGNADAAARLCATLSGTRRTCQPTPFEGRELSLVAPEPPRPPPVAAPQRKPAPKAVQPNFPQ